MTHEKHGMGFGGHALRANDQAGPEHDDTLPDALDIPVFDTPEESFSPPLTHDLED